MSLRYFRYDPNNLDKLKLHSHDPIAVAIEKDDTNVISEVVKGGLYLECAISIHCPHYSTERIDYVSNRFRK